MNHKQQWQLNRRDFLRTAGVGAASLTLPALLSAATQDSRDQIFDKADARIETEDFAAEVTMRVSLGVDRLEELETSLAEASSGTIALHTTRQ